MITSTLGNVFENSLIGFATTQTPWGAFIGVFTPRFSDTILPGRPLKNPLSMPVRFIALASFALIQMKSQGVFSKELSYVCALSGTFLTQFVLSRFFFPRIIRKERMHESKICPLILSSVSLTAFLSDKVPILTTGLVLSVMQYLYSYHLREISIRNRSEESARHESQQRIKILEAKLKAKIIFLKTDNIELRTQIKRKEARQSSIYTSLNDAHKRVQNLSHTVRCAAVKKRQLLSENHSLKTENAKLKQLSNKRIRTLEFEISRLKTENTKFILKITNLKRTNTINRKLYLKIIEKVKEKTQAIIKDMTSRLETPRLEIDRLRAELKKKTEELNSFKKNHPRIENSAG